MVSLSVMPTILWVLEKSADHAAMCGLLRQVVSEVLPSMFPAKAQ
jgi:hypothetical protein